MTSEWRLNSNLSFSDIEFTDLFVDDVYQSMWLERDVVNGTWQFVAFDLGKSYRSPIETTRKAAIKRATAYMAVQRLEGRK